ncbi:hypothetical protein [Pseudodesulfovibrio karagichevae]|uniref:Uncharacterized protein n=1 Tax=Pseudodesulfovibrio karagichevae TaxID=3239305 RepID=A0ABV4JXC0_9BACT
MFALHIVLPAVILLKAPQIAFSREMAVPAVIPWVMLFFPAALVLRLGRLFKWTWAATGGRLLIVPMGMAFWGGGQGPAAAYRP